MQSEYSNLLAVINDLKSSDRGITFISRHDENFLSYSELHRCAQGMLYILQSKGMQPKDELIFQLDDNRSFIVVFWACILGGIIPVPVSAGNNEEHKLKLARVWAVLNKPYLVTTQEIFQQIEKFGEQHESFTCLETMKQNVIVIEHLIESEARGTIHTTQPDDIALIQFSSGSTGEPKGVILTHRNILCNIHAIIKGAKITSEDCSLSWMPLTHDMGLIGFHLAAMTAHINQLIMPPALFILAPDLWIQKAHEHQVTSLSSPNFGYKHFLNHYKSEQARDWDLSHVRLLFNGAEPISAELSEQFLNAMEPYGMRSNVMFPVYGMAEASLAVTFPPVEEPLVPVHLDRSHIVIGEAIREVEHGVDDCLTFVDVGYPVEDCYIRIYNDNEGILADRHIGNIHIKGNNVTPGYYNNPSATEKLLTKDGWLDTGDLGFIRNGRLVVTGRKKDIIFIRGQNYYPHDLEEIAQNVPGVELGKVAICGVLSRDSGLEEIAAFIVFRGKVEKFIDLVVQLKKLLNKSTGLEIRHVIPVRNIPKTTSGKLQRYKLADNYDRGEFTTVIEQIDILLDQQIQLVEVDLPINELEHKLLALWLDVLGLKKISVHDHFFELGGDSLKAALLLNHIHKVFHIEIPAAYLYEVSTIKKLASYMQDAEVSVYSPIPIAEERAYYPVSSSQYRVYVQEQFDGIGISYNMPIIVHIEGNLDLLKVESVFQELVRRHHSLRTSFIQIAGEIVQVIHNEDEVKLSLALMDVDESGIHAAIDGFIRPFDLMLAPLIRVGIVTGQNIITESLNYHLIIDMHHTISDGISVYELIEQFTKLYQGERVPESLLQYKDYVIWQQMRAQFDERKVQQQYWQDQLSGEIPLLEMPTDYKRTDLRSFQGDKIEFKLSNEVLKKLSALALLNHVTLNTVMVSIYSILLGKYTRQQDLIVGSLVSGRNHADLGTVIGMFVNYIPLRMNVDLDYTYSEFLASSGRIISDAYQHQDYPYEDMVIDLPTRSPQGRNPLFDTMLIMHNQMDIGRVKHVGEMRLSFEEWSTNTSKLDFKLDVYVDSVNGLVCKLEYNRQLFKHETMKRLTQHFVAITHAVLNNPHIRLGHIDMLTSDERKQVLEQFNQPMSMSALKGNVLHQWFEAAADQRPDHIAVLFGERRMTYRELNEKANQLARVLQANGLSTNRIAAIVVDRSMEMMIGILAIMKAGGAYLPISPEYPMDRLHYMLADSESVILLTQSQWISNISFTGAVINLEDESLYCGECTNLQQIVQDQDLAYVIYTSGSTGNPKGVMIEHGSAVNRILWMQRQYPLGPSDVIMQKTAFTFDVSVWELFWWSFAGATVSFLIPGGEKDPETMIRTIKDHQVTTLHFVPSMLHLFLVHVESPRVAEQVKIDLASLKYVFASGEALPVQQVDRFYQELSTGDVKLINLYGPTEASIDVSYYDCQAEEQLESVPIGKPIDNIQLYIVDEERQLLPIGIPGELCIAGIGLARGYIGLPQLTAEKFIDNPFVEGTRMYRTGDLARWLPDGTISYMGRLDHQVKLRGYRIELGEIEAGLLRHTNITEAAVLLREAVIGDKQLYAYIVTNNDVTVAQIREHLGMITPDYMIPSHYCHVEKMPLTSSGKVDRKSLSSMEVNLYTSTTYIAPQNDLEEKLVSIWKAVLHLEQVGTTDNFFEIGGHSLKATEILHRVHQELEVNILLREIFNSPTIQGLATIITNSNKSIFHPIKPVEARSYYPLTSAQSRLYILQQFDGIGTAYHLPVTLAHEGIIDLVRLEQALIQLIDRHEILRTSFSLIDGIPVQCVHEQTTFAIEQWIDNESALPTIIKEFVRPFDLNQAPLLRAGIVKLSSERHIILFDMHHVVSDGVSMGIVVNDFVRLYEGNQLEELVIQYKDFAVWQQDFLKSGPLKKQEQYWLEQFADGIPIMDFPTDFNRQSMRSFEGDKVSFVIDEEHARALKKLASEMNATLYMTLLATFTIFLSRYSGQEDIIVGTPVSGRPHVDLHNMIGMFVNTIALRNYPSSQLTFKQYVSEIRENTLAAFENQDYPFEELVGSLQLNRDMSRNPLFDVMFVMQNMNIPELKLDEGTMNVHEFQHTSAKFDFTLEVTETDNGLACHFEYCTKLFHKDTVEQWITHYRNVIIEVTDNPAIVLGDIHMLTQDEEITLINRSQGVEASYPIDRTLHQLFEEQVEKTPSHIAVVCEHEQWTFRELNEQANLIAHHLQSMGVTRDQPVGLMIDRSLDMVASMLAILKAGGAYVPIDPAYPSDRIEYMMEDSGALLLLADSCYVEQLKGLGSYEVIDLSKLPTQPTHNLIHVNQPDDMAYIIYTSGTTGMPKGVMIEHRNVVRLLINDRAIYDFNDQDVWTMFHSFCFDFSVWEMYGALLYGGKLVVLSKQVAQNPQLFLDLMISEKVTVLNQTPSAFYTLIPYEVGRSSPELQLRYIIFGGDALKPAMLTPWKLRYPETQFINMYGITETTVHVTYKEISAIEIEHNISNIGVPIPTLSCYILNEHLKLVPKGVIGELYVGGEGVARGYMNNEKLTKERFLSNPFKKDERIYRSGDLAKWLPSGELEYYGRIDHQVKIRGYRIELGEIESSLLKHQEISASVVLVRESEDGDKQLWAYVATNQQLTVPELRNHLSLTLPDYMIPAFYVQMEEIPLTVNGKVDRNTLLRMDGRKGSNVEYTAPQNELEHSISEIWRKVLGLEEISIHDNFFDIGGHSLLLIRMHSLLEADYSSIVKVTDLFAYTTIHKLAAFIEAETTLSSAIMNVQPIELPESFFVDRPGQLPSASFKLQLDTQLSMAVINMASGLNNNVDPILTAVFVLVFAQFTKKARHSIQVMTPDQKVRPLDIDLSGDLDVSKLMHAIKEKLEDSFSAGEGILIKDRIKSMPIPSRHCIYPLFYNNSHHSMNMNLNDCFDLIVSYRVDNEQITLFCDYNTSRLQKEKVKEFFQGYVKLTRWFSDQYMNHLQVAAAGIRGANNE